MYVGKNWEKGIQQAQANANASNYPWIVFVNYSSVYCERATEADMRGESAKVRDGGKVVEPQQP